MTRPATTRSQAIFAHDLHEIRRRADRMFLVLLLAQWVFAIGLATWLSPLTWSGRASAIHVHVKLAILLGGAINLLPIALILARPGWWGTRHAVAFAQMLWSALLIHLTGGRIETHFHVFGSLAFLAYYRDWRVLLTATIVVAADHLARGLFWPESVYGLANPEWWRFLEHAFWVVFEDIVLVFGCVRGLSELRTLAERGAALELTNAEVEAEVVERTAELAASMARYRDLVENTGALPWELDVATDRLTYVAPETADTLGTTVVELARPGMIDRWVHADDRAGLRAAIADAATHPGVGRSVDYRLVPTAGDALWIRATLTAPDAGQVRAIGIDVSRQRELEVELRQAQKLESLGRLAAGVAHEINTPIQFVRDSVEFIRDASGDVFGVLAAHQATTAAVTDGAGATAAAADRARAAEAATDIPLLIGEIPAALDRALDGLDRVAVIVKSMKQVAYPARREMTEIDLNTALRSTLTIARSEYRYVAELEADLGDLPPVRCHPGDIGQAVLNLVVNAAHAIADVVGDSGRKGTIVVRSRCDGDAAVITVTDDGGGIPDHVRERMFDPFFTTKDVGRGTGQGLAIARAMIVDTHRGTLTCDTEVGRGTTFTLRIPLGVATRSPEELAA